MKQSFTKIVVSGALALSSLSWSALPAFAAEEALIVDDNDSSFVYCAGTGTTTGWTAESGSSVDVTEHWSNVKGAAVTWTFTGHDFELYGFKAPNHLNLEITADDFETVIADCYAPSRSDGNALLFSSKDMEWQLEEGEHTVVIEVSKTANASAVNAQGVSLTYGKIYREDGSGSADGYTLIEDSLTTTTNEPFKIQYSSGWHTSTGISRFHNGDEHYAYPGASYSIAFTGSKAEIYATAQANHGTYTVTIDGTPAGTANGIADSQINQTLIYSSGDLEYGDHTMTVTLEEGNGSAIQVDYLKIYHETLQPASLTLTPAQAMLAPGTSMELQLGHTPWPAEVSNIVWTSSNAQAVSVENGTIQAAENIQAKTTAVITASVPGSDICAQASVTVDPARSVMSASVGDEKLLNTSDEYDTLVLSENSTLAKTVWKNDAVNAKVNVSAAIDLTSVSLSMTPLTDSAGTVLQADAQIAWLEDVEANIGRSSSSAPVRSLPDKIGRQTSIDIPARTSAFSWIVLSIPEEARAGKYQGQIEISCDQLDEPVLLSVSIEVLDLSLPDDPASEVQLWQHPFSAANYALGLGSTPTGGISYDSQDDFYFSKAHLDLMRDSAVEYAALGGRDAVANIVEEAWNHQSYYNDPSMISWTKNADGTWSYDYTWYDAWIEFMIDCGVLNPDANEGKIKCYSIVPWNNQVAYYDAASQKTVKESAAPGSDAFISLWTPFLRDFARHSEEKGWMDITYIAMDERSMEQLQPSVELIESVLSPSGKQFKISSCLNYTAPSTYEFTDRIHDISINQSSASNRETMRALTEHRSALGLTTTLYTCTGNYPGSFAISDPGDNYWTMWNTASIGADGFLRWAYDNFVYDMHGNITYRYWEPGDGWFIYPEKREDIDLDGDTSSLSFYSTPRFEMLKQGVRDVSKYKYLMSCDGLSDEDKAQLKQVIESLQIPSGTTSYGSATYANDAARALAHSETARMLDAVNAAARKVAPSAAEPEISTLLSVIVRETSETLWSAYRNDAGQIDQYKSDLSQAASLLESDASVSQKDEAARALNGKWMTLRRIPTSQALSSLAGQGQDGEDIEWSPDLL